MYSLHHHFKPTLHYLSFPREWYNEVGCVIVTTVTIQMITSPFFWLIDWAVYKLKIMWDRRSCSYSRVTQQVSQQGYISLYSGSPFQLENNYSILLTLVCICLVFGPSLPLLYFSGLIGTIIIFIQDTVLIGKHHPRPLAYSNRLGVLSMYVFIIAPILSFFIFLQMINSDNLIYEEESKEEAELLFFCIKCFIWFLIAFVIILMAIVYRTKTKIADENLLPYTQSLSKSHLQRIYSQIQIYRALGIKKISEERAEEIKTELDLKNSDTERHNRKQMQGTPSYDIMIDERYISLFNYRPPRELIGVGEDISYIAKIIYYPYLSGKIARPNEVEIEMLEKSKNDYCQILSYNALY